VRRPRVIYWVVFLDALLLFAIVPLLPQYVRDLDMSKTQAGIAVGAYSGAVLGRLADRRPLERADRGAAADDLRGRALAVSTLALAEVSSFAGLFGVRVGQGLSSAVSWTAGMAWLSEASPPSERGRVLGAAMSFASIGTLCRAGRRRILGSAYGVKVPFIVLGLAAALDRRLSCSASGPGGGRAGAVPRLARTLRESRLVLAALVVMTLVATVSGTLDTLVPLRMGQAGYSAIAITGVLTVAGVLATVCNYSVGRLFDRIGGIRIAVVSILATAALVALPVVFAAAVVVIAVFLISTPPIAGQYAVAFPLCAAGADGAGIAHSSVFGILNLAWGLGFLIGPAAGAAIAEASSDRVTYALLVALMVVVAANVRSLALSA
jgi:DHA1 family L-arabinose/isopropyl-beta-D-thiogalactopyranoside export protein-like MFS transporter